MTTTINRTDYTGTIVPDLFINLDVRTGALYADVPIPGDRAHGSALDNGLALCWYVHDTRTPTAEVLNDLMRRMEPLAQKLVDDTEIDGSLAIPGEAAWDARDELDDLVRS